MFLSLLRVFEAQNTIKRTNNIEMIFKKIPQIGELHSQSIPLSVGCLRILELYLLASRRPGAV